jgi:hypothetical protein
LLTQWPRAADKALFASFVLREQLSFDWLKQRLRALFSVTDASLLFDHNQERLEVSFREST